MVIASNVVPPKKRKKLKIRRGSTIAFTLGAARVKAIVIEDPRCLRPGLTLLRIRADLHDGLEPLECNIVEEDAKAVAIRGRRAA